jgi:SAM-dependent methyltransferase
MNELPSSTFEGLASIYQKHRPSYPDAVMERIAKLAPSEPCQALDVGAGTGIASRGMAQALGSGWHVKGLEPGADMLREARRSSDGIVNLSFEQSGAETLPVANGTTGLILVAQALHWFDRPLFYSECGRVLAPGGRLMVLYNDRDPDGALTSEFEARMEAEIPDYDRAYRSFDYVGEIITVDWGEAATLDEINWTWHLTTDQFAGLMLSRSKGKPWVDRVGRDAVEAELIDLARQHSDEDGIVPLPYITRLAHVQRRGV